MIEAIPRKAGALGRVLFLCGENYHASRFCEELFNSHSRVEGLNWQALSRAVLAEPAAKNEGPISLPAVEYLRLLGAAPVNHLRLPLRVTDFDLAMSADVIALGLAWKPHIERLWPYYAPQVRYWRLPALDRPRAALAHLSCEVRSLVTAIQLHERHWDRPASAPMSTA